MTVFRPFEELTWPEVSSLPRNIPIALPLGSGYPLNQIAEAFNNPKTIYLLPPFPFGWQGSVISVQNQILEQYLANILFSLRDDGFSNCLIIVPPGVKLRLTIPWIALQNHSENKSDILSPIKNKNLKVAVIPLGHTEQHGHHLPLSTDTLIIDAIAKGIGSLASELTAVFPVMPYGVSTHRQSFAGTLSAGGRAYEDFWVNVIDVLTDRGFDMFYLINGHGGNSSFINNVIKYSGERHRRIFCASAWLYLSGPQGIASLEKYRKSRIGGMGHACELETSLILFLKPDLVHMDRVVDETNFITTPSYYMDWVEGGALIANPPWDDDTETGAYGAGSLATHEKGRIWLEAAISEKISHVHEIIEQQRMREERRTTGYGLWGK